MLIDNLLENACRHASGKIIVSISAERGEARLDVEDDGLGMFVG